MSSENNDGWDGSDEAWESYGREHLCREIEESSAVAFWYEQIRAHDPSGSILEYEQMLVEERLISDEQRYYGYRLMRDQLDKDNNPVYEVGIEGETPELMRYHEAMAWAQNVRLDNKDAIAALLANLKLLVERGEIVEATRQEATAMIYDRLNRKNEKKE